MTAEPQRAGRIVRLSAGNATRTRWFVLIGCASLIAVAGATTLTTTSYSGPTPPISQVVRVVTGAGGNDARSSSPAASDTLAADDQAAAAAAGTVSIHQNELWRDGRQWNPHAVQLLAFVQAPYAQNFFAAHASAEDYDKKWKWFKQAYDRFSNQKLDAIKNWGADTVRFQVSSRALDPDNHEEYDSAFVAKVVAAVKYARSIGLNAIVSIQAERQVNRNYQVSGDPLEAGALTLPNDAVRRDWQTLAPLLKVNGASDEGIIFEMLNEPSLSRSPDHWQQWASAMNQTAQVIRTTNSTNVLLADGLGFALSLQGLVPLADAKVFYAVHAYFIGTTRPTTSDWDRDFGNAAKSVPVINGEWTTLTNNDYENTSNGYWCSSDVGSAAVDLLKYQKAKGIGLVGVAYDNPKHWGGIVQDYDGTPTTFQNSDCQNALGRFGPGKTVQQWYKTTVVPDTPL